MAWYTPSISKFSPNPKPALHPALYRFIQPPLHDANFRSICANTESKIIFAHVRAATATAITQTNNHPFVFGIHTIMHNGYISDFAKIKRKMCERMTQEAFEHIQGGTDTEHFAALLISFLCASGDAAKRRSENDTPIPPSWEQYHSTEEIKTALRKTIATIIAIQNELLGAEAAQPNDLNIAITDGRSLVACRFRNHATEQPPSLYYSTTAGVTLNRQYPDHPDGKENGQHGSTKEKGNGAEGGQGGHNPYAKKRDPGEHGKHLIVASEPTTYKVKEWTLIAKNTVVLVDEGRGGDVRVEDLEV